MENPVAYVNMFKAVKPELQLKKPELQLKEGIPFTAFTDD